MTIASGGTLGTGTHSTSASSFTFNTATNALAAGDFGLLVVSTDNIQTSTGNSTDHTSVLGSNLVATKLGEYTNGQSAAGAGATVSAWLLEATGAVAIGTTITVNLSGAVVDKTSSFWKFTKAAGHAIRVSTAFTPNPIVSAINAANGFGSSAFSGGASVSRLYFRALAKEANSTTALTVSSGFTSITPQRSRNNAAAMCVRGEFRINTSTGETSNPTMAVVGDTAGLFFALEEYDARPVISVQPKNQFVLDGATATFTTTVSGATSFQWKKYTPGGGGGGSSVPLGITHLNLGVDNPNNSFALPNYEGGSQQIPDGANACLIGCTFFSYGTGGATAIAGSAFSVPTNGGDIRNLDQNNSFMSFWGRAMKVGTPSGADTISITLTGANYGEGPVCQIVWLSVADPDDFVRDYKQGTGNGAVSIDPTTDPADIVVGFYGKDVTGGTPATPSGVTKIGSTAGPYGGDYQLAFYRSAAGSPATSTNVTIPSTSYPCLAAFAIKGVGGSPATWDNVSGGTGGTTDDYTTPTLSTADDGARFRLEAANAYGTTISNEVIAFVSPDGKLVLKALSTAPAESPSSVSSKNIPAPSGILEGFRELMLVGVGATSGGTPVINTPAGWTTQAEWQSSALSIGGGVFALRLALFERKADGPGATVAMTSTAAGYWGWHRTAWAFDAEEFIASVNLDDLASSTAPVLPGMTPSKTNAYLLDWLVLGATAGITEALGMTELSENTDHSIGLYGKQLTDTSPVGSRTYAFSPTADAGFAVVELHSLASALISSMNLKARVDGSWVDGSLKRWNGTSWEEGALKRWDGSDFV